MKVSLKQIQQWAENDEKKFGPIFLEWIREASAINNKAALIRYWEKREMDYLRTLTPPEINASGITVINTKQNQIWTHAKIRMEIQAILTEIRHEKEETIDSFTHRSHALAYYYRVKAGLAKELQGNEIKELIGKGGKKFGQRGYQDWLKLREDLRKKISMSPKDIARALLILEPYPAAAALAQREYDLVS